MKIRLLNIVFYLGVLILLCIIIYPYTRFAYTNDWNMPSDIKLNTEKEELVVGESFSLYIENVGKRASSYKTSNFKIASVSIWGKVKAKAPGRAIISVDYEEETLKCLVLVSE